MIDQYVLASNDDGDLAIRTVQATESSSVTDTTSVITATDDGKLAVRVVGSGGGDSHNKGYYATQSALETAYPTAEAGDWAIVGATDTVWVWDTDTSAWVDTGAAGIELPDQTGHSGQFLTTDGTAASWSDKPLVNKATGTKSFIIGNSNDFGGNYATSVGNYATAYNYATSLGSGAWAQPRSLAIGASSGGLSYVSDYISIGYYAQCYANYAIQLGRGTNTTAGTMSVGLSTDGNTWNNYELLSSDGTIPTARFTTDPVSDGTYYPTLTISSGTSTRSWSTIAALQNTTTNTNSLAILGSAYDSSCINSVAIGKDAVVYSQDTVAIGYNSYANGQYGVAVGKGAQSFRSGAIALGNGAHAGDNQSIAIGYSSNVGDANSTGSIVIGSGSLSSSAGTVAIGVSAKTQADGCIQLGGGTNTDAGTFCVATKTTQYGTYTNYKLMDSDGTIPTERLTKVNSTVTIAVADWNGSTTVTKTVTGVTATGVVLVSPDPTDQAAYTSAGILCTAQAANSLTFTCSTTPTAAIDVNVVML